MGRCLYLQIFHFLVDDGTGVISCVRWHEKTSSAESISRIDRKKKSRLIQDDHRLIQFGDLVTIEGRLSIYRDERQVTISKIFLERDPNAEIHHWIRTIDLRTHIYNK